MELRQVESEESSRLYQQLTTVDNSTSITQKANEKTPVNNNKIIRISSYIEVSEYQSC